MNICVFCSSSNAVDKIYFQEAENLGIAIGEKGNTLLYGGTKVGLMNQVAFSVKSAGGKVIGIIPELIRDYGISADYLDELFVTPDMMQRKKMLRDKSDAFIALPGGFGTLEEVMEIITLKQLNYHNLPVVLINTNGFYQHLQQQFECFYQEKFTKEEYRNLFYFADDYKKALAYIENYKEQQRNETWN